MKNVYFRGKVEFKVKLLFSYLQVAFVISHQPKNFELKK